MYIGTQSTAPASDLLTLYEKKFDKHWHLAKADVILAMVKKSRFRWIRK